MVRILANTNPDIELVVGVDSNNSYTAMKDGINQVIRDIESRDPPKIKIHLDDTEINSKLQSLRSQITDINNQKISISISGLDVINNSILKVSDTITDISSNIKSTFGSQTSSNTLNIDMSALQGFVNVLSETSALIRNCDTSALSGDISNVGENAQTAAIFLGRYRDALNDAITTKVHSSLTDLGIAAKDADVISKHLSDMNINVKAITPEWETITKIIDEEIVKEQKLKQITVQGTTALGDAVNHVIKFSTKTGDISKEITRATVKGKEFTQTMRELSDGTKETNVETTVAELKEIDGLIKSIEKTNSTLNSSRNKATDALGGLSTTGKNREELDAINKKFDELMVATERLKTNRMTANQEDVDGLRKIQEELDALIRKSQERLRIEAESKDLSSATSAEKNVSRIKEMLNTKDIDASVAKVTDRFEKLGDSGAKGLGKVKTGIVQINTLLASLKSPRVLSNDNALLSTYQELSTLLETVSNRISIIESRTNTSKKINFGLETKKFQADIDAIYQSYNKLNNVTDTIRTNLFKLQDEFNTLNSYSTSQDQKVAAFERLKELIPVVTKQISVQAAEEAKAIKIASANNKIIFSIDTDKFKTDIDVLQQKLNDLTNKTAPLYSTITKNMTDLQAAFKQMNDPAVTQDQRVAAYQRLNDLIPVVTKQIRAQATAEAAAANAAKKAKAEAVRGAKQQIAENEQANVQRKIAYQLIAQIAQAQKEWTKARNGSMSNEYAKLQSYSSQLTTLLNQLSSGTIGKSDFSAQVKNIGNEFVRTSSIIRTAGEDTKTLADRFGSLGSKFSIWFSTTRIIMMVYTNIRKMISASIELDKTMTQLQIVTKQNDDAMTKFGDSAAAAAKRIGSSITDFVSSATTYARLGYSLDESSRLAEFTAMLQNVGDIDVSEAQDAITSIVKAFNIGTDQIESVMDKMVISGNNFPISVSQIAEGMKNASSALAAAGNSFDQSVALLTAANTTIQDAAKSSTGLRTIAARIRKTKTELDDLGETMSEADYEKLVKSLTDMNVALTENGEYRSTYDIIKDIAAQWKNMTSMEQAALTEALAGKRLPDRTEMCE